MANSPENDPEKTDVFTDIESEIDIKIPFLLRVILSENEINDRVTISKIDDAVIEAIKRYCEDADNIKEIAEKWRKKAGEVKGEEDHEKYLTKPHKFLAVAGTKMRLDALIQHCIKYPNSLNKLGKKRGAAVGKAITSSKKKLGTDGTESSMSGTDLSKNHVPNVLRAVKQSIQKLNVVEEDRDNLLSPTVTVLSLGESISAHLVCTACPTSSFKSPSKLTVYKKLKQNSWIVSNYTRHVERCHLKKPEKKPQESVSKYFSKENSDGGEGSNGAEEIISDEEEHERMENFLHRKE